MAFAGCMRRSATRLASVCGNRSMSAVVNCPSSLARKPSPLSPFVSRTFPYSTAVDRMSSELSLLRIMESQISSSRELHDRCSDDDDEKTPGSIPFSILDRRGDQTVTLIRRYNGEDIKVVASMPSFEDDENEDDDKDDEGPSNGSSIPLVVTITKESGLSLEFSCKAFPDEIDINALSLKKPKPETECLIEYYPTENNQLVIEWPHFEDLDKNLKKTFYKYLEIRGVKPSMTNFLHEYMLKKVKKDYLFWLKNVEKFMEERKGKIRSIPENV